MGIKNLTKFLREKYPELFQPVSIAAFAHTHVAVDTSVFLHRFMYVSPDWLNLFLSMVLCLRRHSVHPVFVFDSGKADVAKSGEKLKRAKRYEQQELRIFELQAAFAQYQLDGICPGPLLEFYLKGTAPSVERLLPRAPGSVTVAGSNGARLLTGQTQPRINHAKLVALMEKLERSLIRIQPEDLVQLKRLFTSLGVPYLQAPLEAETLCCSLCLEGRVSAILSSDTDVLAYGGSRVIGAPGGGDPAVSPGGQTPPPEIRALIHFDPQTGGGTQLRYPEVLLALGLTPAQFLDFCILCGNDYNSNLPKIGTVGSLALLKKYGSIEAYGAANPQVDLSILNHLYVRNLFLVPKLPPASSSPSAPRPTSGPLNSSATRRSSTAVWSGYKSGPRPNSSFKRELC